MRSEQTSTPNEKPHRKLKLWKASMDFVADLYRELERLPAQEKFGLTARLQRAAVSIPSNIAEGAARKNTKELVQFLHVARGSLSELDRLEEISKMLDGLIVSLAKKP